MSNFTVEKLNVFSAAEKMIKAFTEITSIQLCAEDLNNRTKTCSS